LRREAGEDLLLRKTFFDLEPKSYQQDMLDALQAERGHGRHRSLVVAATGTGKTVVAAFDYRRLCSIEGGRPKLLFVAHREEILRQSMRTYREVLRDNTFGALLVGGVEPDSYDHLFATIDSVDARSLLDRFSEDHWHTVVVDECHRLAAERFDHFVTRVKPRYLLGLTATPERSDGRPILHYFDNRLDGAPAMRSISNCCVLLSISPVTTTQIFRRFHGLSRVRLRQ
jgi:superfamily II DNA or RNA helicase